MKAYYHKFEVCGDGGVVPTDMLRYDHCFPASPNGFQPNRSGRIELAAIAPKTWKPTTDRWRSFGWLVFNHTMSPTVWA